MSQKQDGHNLFGSGYGSAMASCEYGHEHDSSVKQKESLGLVSNHQLQVTNKP
jgi:hypothetical protein